MIANRKIFIALFLIILTVTAAACSSQEGGKVSDRLNQEIEEEAQTPQQSSVNPEKFDESKPVETLPAIPQTQPSQQSLFVDIISFTSPVSPGSLITLFAKTKPKASCTIEVSYQGGPEEAGALVEKQAEENGLVSWTWTVDPSAAYGSYTITVTAKEADGQIAKDAEIFEIKSPEECKK